MEEYLSEKFCVSKIFDTIDKCKKLSVCCPFLEDLEINCRCNISGTEQVDQFLGTFPKLQRIKCSHVTENIAYLRKLKSVSLVQPKWIPRRLGIVQLAADIGIVACEVMIPERDYHSWIHDVNASPSDVMCLQNCTNLSTLHIILDPELEYHFPLLPNIRFLKLFWKSPLSHDRIASSNRVLRCLTQIATHFPLLEKVKVDGLASTVEKDELLRLGPEVDVEFGAYSGSFHI